MFPALLLLAAFAHAEDPCASALADPALKSLIEKARSCSLAGDDADALMAAPPACVQAAHAACAAGAAAARAEGHAPGDGRGSTVGGRLNLDRDRAALLSGMRQDDGASLPPGGMAAPRPTGTLPPETEAMLSRGVPAPRHLDEHHVPEPAAGPRADIYANLTPFERLRQPVPGDAAFQSLKNLNAQTTAGLTGEALRMKLRENYESVFGPQGSDEARRLQLNAQISLDERTKDQLLLVPKLAVEGYKLLGPGGSCPDALTSEETGLMWGLEQAGCGASFMGFGIGGVVVGGAKSAAPKAMSRLARWWHGAPDVVPLTPLPGKPLYQDVALTLEGQAIKRRFAGKAPWQVFSELKHSGQPVYAGQNIVNPTLIAEYAAQMRSGNWQWGASKIEMRLGDKGELVIKDGHHRFLAAKVAGVDIPPSAIDFSRKDWKAFDWKKVEWAGK